MKEGMTILAINFEKSMSFVGWKLLCRKDNKFKSVGTFSIDLLNDYENMFNVVYIEKHLREEIDRILNNENK